MPVGVALDLRCFTLFSLSLTITQKRRFVFLYWVEHMRLELAHLSSVELPKLLLPSGVFYTGYVITVE